MRYDRDEDRLGKYLKYVKKVGLSFIKKQLQSNGWTIETPDKDEQFTIWRNDTYKDQANTNLGLSTTLSAHLSDLVNAGKKEVTYKLTKDTILKGEMTQELRTEWGQGFENMILYKTTDQFIVTGKQNGDYTPVKNKRTKEQGFIYSSYIEPNSSEGKITVRIMDLFK